MASNLLRRIGFAAVAIPGVVGVLYAGGWPLAGLVAVAAWLGTREVYGLARATGLEPLAPWGYATAALIPLTVQAGLTSVIPRIGPVVVVSAIWFLVLLIWATRYGPSHRPLASVAATVLAVLYAAALPAFLLPIRAAGASAGGRWAGVGLALFPLVLTWACDTAAMAGGHAIGGRRLAPVLSPNKTWAGAITGGLSAVVLAPALAVWVLRPLEVRLEVLAAVLVGVGVAVGGQWGDVVESMFKREVGVKDSSNLLPGHGGVLDRLDSLYFVVPITAAVLLAFDHL